MFIFFETVFEIVFDDLIRPFVCGVVEAILGQGDVGGILGLLFQILNFFNC